MNNSAPIKKKKNESGMALVLVVLILSLLTTMVVEFAYGIYVNTTLLDNWRRLQSVSLTAESGMSLAIEMKRMIGFTNTPLHNIPVPPLDVFGSGISVSGNIIDESSKLDVNSIVDDNGDDTKQTALFKRLVEDVLNLPTSLTGNMQDYIYETGYGKKPLESIEELLLVAGVDRAVYNSISPYVTVYGTNPQINLNTASAKVIMSLAEGITLDDAEAVVEHRAGGRAFKDWTAFKTKFSSTVYADIRSDTVKFIEGPYMIDAVAFDVDGMTREIKCVISAANKVLYWRER